MTSLRHETDSIVIGTHGLKKITSAWKTMHMDAVCRLSKMYDQISKNPTKLMFDRFREEIERWNDRMSIGPAKYFDKLEKK